MARTRGDDVEQQQPDGDEAGTAIVFNKREVARLDLAAPHRLVPDGAGWRIAFSAAGSVRVDMARGPKEVLAVVEGDFLLSTGEDLYLTRRGAQPARDEREDKAQARKRAREQKAEPKAPTAAPKARRTKAAG